jgi:hypothetical protein
LKRLLSLVLSLVLLVSVASMSFAAVTLTGGQIRLWNENVTDNGNHLNLSTFFFDRLNLDFKADFGDNTGVLAEARLANLGNGSTPATATTRADYAYYYHKNLFTNGDEFDFGAFDPMPFKNGFGNALLNGGFGDMLKLNTDLGVMYSITDPVYTIAFGISDAAQNAPNNPAMWNNNTIVSPQGYNYSFRFNYLPIAGLKVGLGYEHVVTFADARAADGGSIPGSALNDAANNYDNRMIVDASYNNKDVPYVGMIEYAQINPTRSGTSYDALNGVYAEGGYKMGAFLVYVGRAMDITSSTASGASYNLGSIFAAINGNCFAGGTSVFTIENNYNVIGLNYALSSTTALQAEYVAVDNGTGANGKTIDGQSAFGLRLLVNF